MLISSLSRLEADVLAVATVPQPLATWVAVGSLVTASLGVILAVKTQVVPWVSLRLKRRSIERQSGASLFTVEGIERAMRHYVAPLCQNVDPAGEEDLRAVVPARQKLFESLGEILHRPGKQKYVMLLADSGMGKTSALLNFYVCHLRRWSQPFGIAVVPLGDPGAVELVRGFADKRNTSLFLDALDEDPAAIRDLPGRLEQIVELTRDFRTVLITCRTQFFSSDMEMPRKVGVLRFDARPAGEEGEYLFYKLYLSPLNDRQVSKYLRLRYPFWRWRRRRAARLLVERLSDLTARPMLLAHVEDILASGEAVNNLGGAYDAIVRAWLQREAAFVEPQHLLDFSKRLAVDLVANRDRRGGEKIPRSELTHLAEKWQVPLETWQLSGRSLLNRDAEGNYKFAHRSIMEFLFALRLTDFDRTAVGLEWTDLIRWFAFDFVDNYFRGEGGPEIRLHRLFNSTFAALFVAHLESGLPDIVDADLFSSPSWVENFIVETRARGGVETLKPVVSLLCRYGNPSLRVARPPTVTVFLLPVDWPARVPLREYVDWHEGRGFKGWFQWSPDVEKPANPLFFGGVVNLMEQLMRQRRGACAFHVTYGRYSEES